MNSHRNYLVPALAIFMGLALTAVTVPAAAARSFGTTLTSPTTPSLVTGADGFIKRWLVLEPITATGTSQDEIQSRNGVQPMVKRQYFANEYSIVPHNGETETVDGKTLTWYAVDTDKYNVNLYHFADSLGKSANNALFWAVTVVNSPREMHNVRLAIGSNAASVWWLNGKEVIGIYGNIQTVVDDGVSWRTTLKKGPNIVRVAVVNGSGASDFCARFLDANDKPIPGLIITSQTPRQ